jgi:hypothetical protein
MFAVEINIRNRSLISSLDFKNLESRWVRVNAGSVMMKEYIALPACLTPSVNTVIRRSCIHTELLTGQRTQVHVTTQTVEHIYGFNKAPNFNSSNDFVFRTDSEFPGQYAERGHG